MSSATKKFALATLITPVLAALAIGLAGSAVAAPAGPQPSDTDTTTTADPDRISVPIKRNAFYDSTTLSGGGVIEPPGVSAFTWATNLVTINFPLVDSFTYATNLPRPKLGTAARPASRTPRGATHRERLLGGERGYYNMIGDDPVIRIVDRRN